MLGFSPLADTPLGADAGSSDVFIFAYDSVAVTEFVDAERPQVIDIVGVFDAVTVTETVSLNVFQPILLVSVFDTATVTESATTRRGDNVSNTLPLKTLSATGVSTEASVNDLPAKTLSASGASGGTGTADAVLPAPQLFAYGGEGVLSDLPLKQLLASGEAGIVGTLAATLPSRTLEASGTHETIGTAVLVLPPKLLVAGGVTGTSGALDKELPALILDAWGESGITGALDDELPALQLDAAGFSDGTGTAVIVLPVLQLDASGYGPVAAALRTWVLNAHNRALTEYKGWTFNSYATFNGKVLAANDDGLFELGTQDLDDDVPIDAVVSDGLLDYGSSMLKRVPYVYAALTTSDAMTVQLTTTEHGTQTYTMGRDPSGLRENRVSTALGPRSRHWQWTLRNKNGGDFQIESLTVHAEEMSRRIQ